MPDSSHGTATRPRPPWPATDRDRGLQTGRLGHPEALRAALGPRTAAVMLTNPSTLGLFEHGDVELLEAVHAAGALAYMDGANMNAVLGHVRPGAFGVDVMHLNVHKTFSTPHGGGGPGAGPIAVAEHLAPFLPGPLVVAEPDGTYRLERPTERPASIGRVRAYHGSTGILVANLRLHPGPRRPRPAPGQRRRRPGRQLPAPARRAVLRAALRRPLQARVRGHRAGPQGRDRRAHAGHRQASHRLRLPSADHLLPPHRRGVHAHRADRDGIDRDPGCLR